MNRPEGVVEMNCAHCGATARLERPASGTAAAGDTHGHDEMFRCLACHKRSRLVTPTAQTTRLVLAFVLAVGFLFVAAGAFLVLFYLLRRHPEQAQKLYLGGALLLGMAFLFARAWLQWMKRSLQPRPVRLEEDRLEQP